MADINFPADTATASGFLYDDGTGNLTWQEVSTSHLGNGTSTFALNVDGSVMFNDGSVQNTAWTGTIAYRNITGVPSTTFAVVDDIDPELGGNLNMNGYCITDHENAAMTFENVPFQTINMITTASGNVFFQTVSSGTVYGNNPNIATISHCVSKGTLYYPESTEPGDYLGSWNVNAFYNGEWKTASGIVTQWSNTANLNDDQPSSNIILQTNGGGTKMNFASFDDRGAFTAPVFSATNYATTSLPATPAPGWMVFDSTTNQFKGWNGSDWVVLG